MVKTIEQVSIYATGSLKSTSYCHRYVLISVLFTLNVLISSQRPSRLPCAYEIISDHLILWCHESQRAAIVIELVPISSIEPDMVNCTIDLQWGEAPDETIPPLHYGREVFIHCEEPPSHCRMSWLPTSNILTCSFVSSDGSNQVCTTQIRANLLAHHPSRAASLKVLATHWKSDTKLHGPIYSRLSASGIALLGGGFNPEVLELQISPLQSKLGCCESISRTIKLSNRVMDGVVDVHFDDKNGRVIIMLNRGRMWILDLI